MPDKKYLLVSVILMLVLALSSCELPYPDQTSATTPNPTSLFTTPLPADNDPMAELQAQATQTALAAGAGGGPTATSSSIPVDQVTATSTPIIIGSATLTPTVTPIVVGGSTMTPAVTSAVPTVTTNRPATYTLQSGEHPYCIARRFDVDPDQLLALSGVTRDQADFLVAGTVLTIPQSSSFPGPRALRPHPATYTVTASGETFYSIACLFGDVDPARIAQANNLSLGSVLTVGQKINIP